MTLYICQCPHRLPAKVWTATSESEALAYLDVGSGISLDVAVSDDMRDAYVTSDPLDLFFWINLSEAPRATRARSAWFANLSVRGDVEALAQPVAAGGEDDDIRFTAFDGAFQWSGNDQEWTLGNQPPVEADDLVHALAEASLTLRRRDRLVQVDA